MRNYLFHSRVLDNEETVRQKEKERERERRTKRVDREKGVREKIKCLDRYKDK